MIRHRHLAGLVAEFLDDALAGGGIAVPELDVMARAAGLLGEHQDITHAKLFKAAKKALGIRSVRNGFGAAGQWLWLLDKRDSPRGTETSPQRIAGGVAVVEDTYAEGKQDVAKDVPADFPVRLALTSWIEGVARLDHHCPFTGIPPHRWRQFLGDCNKFLSSEENWAERAAHFGWDALTLFGCRPGQALSHLGSSGLVWVINGGKLVELRRDWAVIELAANGSQRIFERRRIDAASVSLPWKQTLPAPGRCE
jgi:hypothetical protein